MRLESQLGVQSKKRIEEQPSKVSVIAEKKEP
jgi:hypothetical protein